MKKIIIELGDHEIRYLQQVSEIWTANEGGGEPFTIEYVAATLAANAAFRELEETKREALARK